MTTKQFEFRVVYFRDSGKFYTESKFIIRVSTVAGAPYMQDAVDKVRGWRDAGGWGELPGLSCKGWHGYILVDCEEGYPCLITP